LLLLVLLLRIAPPFTPPVPTTPITVRLIPEGTASPDRTDADEAKPVRGSPAEPTVAPPTTEVPTEVPPVPSSSLIWSQVIPMTRQELAAADIARMPAPSAAPRGESESGGARAQNSGDAAGMGRGPNGELLYNAQWYRRPTPAELAFYIRPGTRSIGWGMIACQTVPDYRVDNCQEIGQSPAGSGLASAVRQAAWQFRVMPPRIGGRPLVGAWVRIRIDYTSKGAKAET
jgi:protein TonB